MADDRQKKKFYNLQQMPNEQHEWDEQSWMWTGLHPQRMKEGGLVPAFRIGVRDRQLMGLAHKMRDFAVDRPMVARFVFGAQHVVARVEQAVRGTEEMYREEAMIRAKYDAGYRYHDACEKCAAHRICDGFHGDYADLFGTAEATPIQGAPIDDPKHYIKNQQKVVEREDEAWAL